MAEKTFAEFKLETQNALDDHEGKITENTNNLNKVSDTVAELRQTVTETSANMNKAVNEAKENLTAAINRLNVGEPVGYSDLKTDLNQLTLRQNNDITPYVVELKQAGISKSTWDALKDKVNTLSNDYSNLPAPQTDISLVLINSVTKTNGGTIINSKVQDGMTLVRFFLEQDNRTDMLTGYWFKDENVGAGIFSSQQGNAFIVQTTDTGGLIVDTAVKGDLGSGGSEISNDLLAYITDLASSTLTKATWSTMSSSVSELKSKTVNSVPLVNVGTITLATGGTAITTAVKDGLSAIKITLGGAVMEGPWVQEGTHGYGLMINNSTGGILSLRLNGAAVISTEISAGTGGSGVSSDLDNISADIIDIKSDITSIKNVLGTLSKIDNKTFYQLLTELKTAGSSGNSGGGTSGGSGTGGTAEKITPTLLIGEFTKNSTTYTATITYNGDGTLSTNLGIINNKVLTVTDDDGIFEGVISASEGTNYKAATINFSHTETSSSGGSTEPEEVYVPSAQAKILLEIVQRMIGNKDPYSSGWDLLNYALSTVSSSRMIDLANKFLDVRSTCSYVSEVFEKYGIDLSNNDTGTVMGVDAGGTISFDPTTIIKKDSSVTPMFPTNEETFTDSKISGGSYKMRYLDITTKEEGQNVSKVRFYVQVPDDITTGEQGALAKTLYWYIPSAIKLVEQALGINMSDDISELNNIIINGIDENDPAIIKDKKGIVICYDSWKDKGFRLTDLGNNVYAKTNIALVEETNNRGASVVIQINSDYFSSVSNNDGKGVNGAMLTLDRVIVGEIAKATLAIVVPSFTFMPRWFIDGIANLVYGIDDQMATEMQDIIVGSGNNSGRLIKAFNCDNKYRAYNDTTYDNYSAIGKATDPGVVGYMFLRWMLKTIVAEQAEEQVIINSLSPAAQKIRAYQKELAKFTVFEDNSPISMMNKALATVTNNKYTTVAAVKEKFLTALATSVKSKETVTAFLKRECDIDLDNTDTGSILGADAGGNVVYSDDDIILEPDNNVSYPTEDYTITVSRSGGATGTHAAKTKTIQDIKFCFTDPSILKDDQEYGLSLMATYHLDLALSTIWKAYGLKLNSNTSNYSYAVIKDNGKAVIPNGQFVYCSYSDDPLFPSDVNDNTSAQCTYFTGDETLKCLGIYVVLNSKYWSKLQTNNVNGVSKNYANNLDLLDKTIAHELTHGTMAVNHVGHGQQTRSFEDSNGNVISATTEIWPLWFTEGIAELLTGIDNYRTADIKKCLSTRAIAEDSLSDTKTSGFVTGADPYSAGYVFLRYMAKQMAGA